MATSVAAYSATIGFCILPLPVPKAVSERWSLLPKLAQLLVVLLPSLGFLLFAAGLRADAGGWTEQHGFLINILTSAIGFCFGIPLVILVFQELSEASGENRERARAETATKSYWANFKTAVDRYVEPGIHREMAAIVNTVIERYATFDVHAHALQGYDLGRPRLEAAPDPSIASDEVAVAIDRLEAWASDRFPPEIWNNVYHSWSMLDSQIRVRRMELDMPWLATGEQIHVTWAMGKGNAYQMFEKGLIALKSLKAHYDKLNTLPGDTPESRVLRDVVARNLPSGALLNAWGETVQWAEMQATILERLVSSTDLRTFAVAGDLNPASFVPSARPKSRPV